MNHDIAATVAGLEKMDTKDVRTTCLCGKPCTEGEMRDMNAAFFDACPIARNLAQFLIGKLEAQIEIDQDPSEDELAVHGLRCAVDIIRHWTVTKPEKEIC